jgi:HSP20 family molecular chaperone IbpA
MNDSTQIAGSAPQAVAPHGSRQPVQQSTARRPFLVPAVDIIEDSNGVTVWADLPGVSREQLDIRVHDGRLTIEAEALVPTAPGLQVQHAEIRAPQFMRAFSLSPDLDAAKIDANLQDGVLKLTIARREEARPRRIEVKVG